MRLPRQVWCWGVMVAVLAIGMGGIYRWRAGNEQPHFWFLDGGVVLAGLAIFFILRGMTNSLWGLAGALILATHPFFFSPGSARVDPLFGHALELTTLALTMGVWQLVFGTRFSWKGWPAAGLGLVLTSALAWSIYPRAGLLAGFIGCLGLLAGCGLAFGRRGKSSWANRLAGVGLGIAAPLGGMALASVAGPLLNDLLPVPSSGNLEGNMAGLWKKAIARTSTEEPSVFSREKLTAWGWPLPLAVLPLMACGLGRGLWRGGKSRRGGKAPLAWLLTFYSALALGGSFFHPDVGPLVSLAVLLVIFLVADLTRGIGERLVLAPPGERDSS